MFWPDPVLGRVINVIKVFFAKTRIKTKFSRKYVILSGSSAPYLAPSGHQKIRPEGINSIRTHFNVHNLQSL